MTSDLGLKTRDLVHFSQNLIIVKGSRKLMEGEPDFASYRQRSATGFVCTQTLFLYHKAQACVEQGDVARLFCLRGVENTLRN